MFNDSRRGTVLIKRKTFDIPGMKIHPEAKGNLPFNFHASSRRIVIVDRPLVSTFFETGEKGINWMVLGGRGGPIKILHLRRAFQDK